MKGAGTLLKRTDIDAIYLATSTAAKEAIVLAAIEAGKHVLGDKPFVNHVSVLQMTEATAALKTQKYLNALWHAAAVSRQQAEQGVAPNG